MKRSKKFLFIALLAVVVLAGSIGGVVYAQTVNNNDNQAQKAFTDNQTQAALTTLLNKVATIYQQNTNVAIDVDQLQKAFDQARSDMRDEALNNYLQGLVTQGKLTQQQADDYSTWLKAKPDVPALPGLGSFGGHRGFGMPGMFHKWSAPPATPPTTP